MEGLLQLVVPAGGDIKAMLLDYLLTNNLTSVYVIGAIGSAKNVLITSPIEPELPLRCLDVPFNVACEVLGFTGEVMEWKDADPILKKVYPDRDDPLFVHIHMAGALAGGHVFGGGFRGGKAFRSLRIFMTRCENETSSIL